MPIRPGSNEQHTFRITGRLGAIPFSTELNGTLQDARARASEFEKPRDNDGMFARSRAQIEMWDGNGFSPVDRYGS